MGTGADHQSGKFLSVLFFQLCKCALFGLSARPAPIHQETSAGAKSCSSSLVVLVGQ